MKLKQFKLDKIKIIMTKNIVVEVVSVASPIRLEEVSIIEKVLKTNNLIANFFENKNTSIKSKARHGCHGLHESEGKIRII